MAYLQDIISIKTKDKRKSVQKNVYYAFSTNKIQILIQKFSVQLSADPNNCSWSSEEN